MGTRSTHSCKRQQTISVGIAEGERIEFALGDGVVRTATVAGSSVAIGGEVRDEWVFSPGVIPSEVEESPTAGAPNGDFSTPLGTKTAQNAPNGTVLAPLGAVSPSQNVIPSASHCVMPGTPAVMPGLTGHLTPSVTHSASPCVMPGPTGHLTPYFTLKGVEIGKGFHWQRRQDQSFRGSLRLIAREGRVIAINVIGIEDYLQCVIASEMSPTAGFEFLKAHAVISRSWLLAQLDKKNAVRADGYSSVECDTPDELIRWQDREDHKYYDFCADDHCQRYQGIPMMEIAGQAGNDNEAPGTPAVMPGTPAVMPGPTGHLPSAPNGDFSTPLGTKTAQNAPNGSVYAPLGASTASVMPGSTGHLDAVDPAMLRKTARVIEATWGQVLWYDGHVCDARFSKCCGGALEEFKYCWENKEVPYLKYARDYESVLADGSRIPAGLLAATSPVIPSELHSVIPGASPCVMPGSTGHLTPSVIPSESHSVIPGEVEGSRHPDLRDEKTARSWILSNPRAFCNTRSKRLLGQVLKDYDSETKDFYRWRIEYSAKELHDIIFERTGEDFGDILDLIPLERGVSGRISRLKIVGTKKTKIIGKELEIRKTLSRSHLYSSAFVVEIAGQAGNDDEAPGIAHAVLPGAPAVSSAPSVMPGATGHLPSAPNGDNLTPLGAKTAQNAPNGSVYAPLGASTPAVMPGATGHLPTKFILHGAGWGHGVGLCQIGAAAMGDRGYDYRTILAHYYPNSTLKNIY